jgi:hypothetical protein
MLNINNLNNALVVGPIYDNLHVLEKTSELVKKYDYVIFNGCLTYPIDNFKVYQRMRLMTDLIRSPKVIYNVSGLDYKLSMKDDQIAAWLKDKPNAVNIKFNRGTFVLVVGGGITPQMKKYHDLNDNLELSFVDKINNKPWHQYYDGRFGYVISNNSVSVNEPKFFNYSAQIGIEYNQNKVYAQEIKENGLQNTFLL